MNAVAHDPRFPPYTPPPASLQMQFCGLQFASPLVLLSGCVGFGEEYTRVAGFSNRDAGAVCLKGTTGKARLGNKPHRVYETPMGMLNAIGLQNPGVDHVVRSILPLLDFDETRVSGCRWNAVSSHASPTPPSMPWRSTSPAPT